MKESRRTLADDIQHHSLPSVTGSLLVLKNYEGHADERLLTEDHADRKRRISPATVVTY
jgi:hypothetical protein